MNKWFFLVLVLLLVSSCAYNQQINKINTKLNDLEQTTIQNSQKLNAIQPRISAIEEKLSKIEEKINGLDLEKANKTKTVVEAHLSNNTLGNSNIDISKIPPANEIFKNKEAETKEKLQSVLLVKNESKKATSQENQKNLSSQAFEAYNNALSDYMKRNFKLALDEFLSFLKTFPNTKLEQNAYFWIGSCYYNLNQYNEAINYFSHCLNDFPKKPTIEGGKTDACLFMLYKTYKTSGDTKKAYEYLMQLKKEYPINPYFEFRGVRR